jgi:hypothetical protein
MQIFYNIFSNSTDAFLGTVAVDLVKKPISDTHPASRAVAIATACDILGGNGAPGGIRAVMSTREMFDAYGLNR